MHRTALARLALMALTLSAAGAARPARAGTLHILKDLGGTNSRGWGVNDSRQVAGDARTASGADHAFLSGPGGGPLTDLGTLGGTSSSANAVK
jgi:probable HAF family extracellular repeat protein